MITFTIAGGCFWCTDGVFQRVKGVQSSICGYSGGTKKDADYYKVANGQTQHAEAIEVTFDETVISPDILLDIFFLIHNPTTLNRQGADEGPQYRSALFYKDDTQKKIFEAAVARAQTHWDAKIITEITPLKSFYEAESEHQDYFTNNPANPYCSIVVDPKISKARQTYADWLK